jgi:3-isopropylmalate/(R)-2-methylmalate dehydratase small subunit
MATGRVVLSLGDDVSTDIIYPGRFMATVLPSETPQHAFADMAEFNRRLNAKEIPPGSVIAAGRNFGCGSSREQAASCVQGQGLRVVARNVARIFLQNAINLGLDMVICPALEAAEGDELEFAEGEVRNLSSGKSFAVEPLPRARQAIIDAGGLIPYTRRLLMERETARAG